MGISCKIKIKHNFKKIEKMQKSACQRGRFSVNTSLLLTNASRKRKPNGAAGHRKQSRTSPRQTENLASQHRLQLRVEGFPSGQREQTVNLPSPTSVVRIHPHPHSAGMAELADALDSGSSEG